MSQNSLQRLALYFQHAGSRDGIQVVSIGGMGIYLLSGLRDFILFFICSTCIEQREGGTASSSQTISSFSFRWLDYIGPIKAPRPARMRTIYGQSSWETFECWMCELTPFHKRNRVWAVGLGVGIQCEGLVNLSLHLPGVHESSI